MKVGSDALKAAGFAWAYIYSALETAKHFGCVISARTGGNAPRLDQPMASKPMAVKAKTTVSDGFLTGFIPRNQQLYGRLGALPLPENSEFVTVKTTLRDLLIGMQDGDYSQGQLFQVSEKVYMEFKTPHADTDEKKNITYYIELTNGEPPIAKNGLLGWLTPWRTVRKPAQPGFWPSNLDFNASLDKFYPVLCYNPNVNVIENVEVLAKDGLPVSGDIDLFSISMSFMRSITDQSFKKLFDSSIGNELTQLLDQYKALCCVLGIPEVAMSNGNFYKKAGLLSPYELAIIKNIDVSVAKLTDNYLQNPLQHGPDVNASYASPIGKVLHILPNETVIMTEDEDELIAFIYRLKGQYVRIHPDWDIKKWAPIVEQQLLCGMPVDPQVKRKYLAYVATLNGGAIPSPLMSSELEGFLNLQEVSMPNLFEYPDELERVLPDEHANEETMSLMGKSFNLVSGYYAGIFSARTRQAAAQKYSEDIQNLNQHQGPPGVNL